jgi:hypothetical protein
MKFGKVLNTALKKKHVLTSAVMVQQLTSQIGANDASTEGDEIEPRQNQCFRLGVQ